MWQYGEALISIFQLFSASIKKNLSLEGRLGTMKFWDFPDFFKFLKILKILNRSATREAAGIYHIYY